MNSREYSDRFDKIKIVIFGKANQTRLVISKSQKAFIIYETGFDISMYFLKYKV